MSELSIEEIKDYARSQESRIEELQQKKIKEDLPESVQRDPVFDLYLDGKYLYLNLELPGVLKQELNVLLKEKEINVSGEFPRLVDLGGVEFLQQLRNKGPFQYRFLIPDDLAVKSNDWQLVNGVLQVRMSLVERKEISLLEGWLLQRIVR